jgi:hypothetical protein
MNERHLGSDIDDFLREEGLLEEVEALAAKRVLDCGVAEAPMDQMSSKVAIPRRPVTGRSSLERP